MNINFEKKNLILEIVKKYGITPNEVRLAILAFAYTLAREKERDEVYVALDECFRLFSRKMMGMKLQEFRKIYKLDDPR